MLRPVVALALIATGVIVAPGLARPPAPAAGDRAAGAREYRAFGCAACHGTTGAGGGWQGPRLAPDPIPFEGFLAQLREPAAKMPRYRATVLTDRQASDIHAYLSAIRRGRPAADIGILNR